jgi:hypothetical protein
MRALGMHALPLRIESMQQNMVPLRQALEDNKGGQA